MFNAQWNKFRTFVAHCDFLHRRPMKYYVRYFENETLVETMKEVVDFLSALPDVELDDSCIQQLTTYITTKERGSKKIFMPNHRSFLVIKTTTATLEEFKANNQKNAEQNEERPASSRLSAIDAEQKGWYECKLSFQRIVTNPDTKKCFYYNDSLEAKVVANSARDAHEQMVRYLQNNPEVDERSQMPAPTSKNFTWKYLGE